MIKLPLDNPRVLRLFLCEADYHTLKTYTSLSEDDAEELEEIFDKWWELVKDEN